ncbi:hypothetical protein MKW92_048348 [Papaver armeniacum]|nr:hypothetical protein MKW92_048348 [Papaver armeniacum]
MAFGISNNLVGIMNFITFLLSISILGGSIWLSQRECEKFLEGPIIALGVLVMIVSLAGLIGACCRVSWLLLVYLIVMIVLIVLLLSFTIFAFVVTNKGAGEVVSINGYKEYKLSNYSNSLQKRVSSEKNWNRIKSCLQDRKVCRTLSEETNVDDRNFQCGFLYKSGVVWDNTGNTTSKKPVLCNLEICSLLSLFVLIKSCGKAEFLSSNIIVLIFRLLFIPLGARAFRNNREDYAYPRWKGHT